jgi:hypothetical protein
MHDPPAMFLHITTLYGGAPCCFILEAEVKLVRPVLQPSAPRIAASVRARAAVREA